ncbi:hypothetical protein [Lutispora sp.]|uniref:hypothetical protein n=1 Tax=Lutispora sp. TaxID=2828727 RepID=UPI0035690D87
MTIYKGKKRNLKITGIVFFCFVAMILTLLLFTERGFFPWLFTVFLLLMCIPTYSGMILSIKMDENKLVIRRPFSWQTLKISNIAFCAVHDIGEGQSTLYIFPKQKWAGRESIKGIKTTMSYEEAVEALSKGGRIQDFKVNFSRAFKVPVSLVENGDELKEKILDCVDELHYKVFSN